MASAYSNFIRISFPVLGQSSFVVVYVGSVFRGQVRSQLRDPVFVDDVVDAFLRAGLLERPAERTFNIGAGQPVSLAEIAQILQVECPNLKLVLRPFPRERKRIDIGSYYSDTTLSREVLRWTATTNLKDGLRTTVDFYRNHLQEYIADLSSTAVCPLSAHQVNHAGA